MHIEQCLYAFILSHMSKMEQWISRSIVLYPVRFVVMLAMSGILVDSEKSIAKDATVVKTRFHVVPRSSEV